MAGWHASMRWEDTGLVWFRPSPAITSPVAAQLHAATGMFEGTNLTVGAGGSVPFETVTARDLRGDLLAARLNERGLPGVRFESVWAGRPGRRLSGVRLVLTDARQFLPATTAVNILAEIRRLHPGLLQFTAPTNGGRYRFDLVWGTDGVRKALGRGDSADRITAAWEDGLRRFMGIRQKYLIYPRGTGEVDAGTNLRVSQRSTNGQRVSNGKTRQSKNQTPAANRKAPAHYQFGQAAKTTSLIAGGCSRAAMCGALSAGYIR